MTKQIDLAIIGSGPAGISTALHLLQLDPSWASRMLVLEKDAHPRPKLCGGGLTRLGIKVLTDLGFEWPLPLPQVYIEDARLVYGKRTIHIRAQPEFVVFPRTEFDAYLVGQARLRGVILHENEPALSFSRNEQSVIIQTSQAAYQVQALVAADGSNGLVSRTLNRGNRRQRVARLLEVFYPVNARRAGHAEGFARFDFTPANRSLQGYFWVFPTWADAQAMVNCGVYDARLAHKRKRADLKLILSQHLRSLEMDPETNKLAGHPIHWFSPASRFACPRIVLVGDAAGADSFFGEGIAPALAYGKTAAKAIQTAFTNQDFTFRHYPRQVLLSPVGRYLLLRWAAAWWIYHLNGRPWFMKLLWTAGGGLASLYPQPKPLPPTPGKPPYE